MRFIRKRKAPSRVQQLTGNVVKEAFQYVQRRWVRLMKKLDDRSSIRQKKWGLIVLLTIGVFYCSLILINAFSTKTSASPQIPTTPVVHRRTLPHSPAARLSSDDTIAIRRFKAALDSMKSSDSGKTVLENLKVQRPGFLDSFYNMEKLIH